MVARLRRIEELHPPKRLADQVKGYLRLIQAEGRDKEWINVTLVESLATSLIGLLKTLKRGGPEFQHHAVQTACLYFVTEEDGEEDMESEEGFDDDVEVMNAVANALGLEELVIDLW